MAARGCGSAAGTAQNVRPGMLGVQGAPERSRNGIEPSAWRGRAFLPCGLELGSGHVWRQRRGWNNSWSSSELGPL